MKKSMCLLMLSFVLFVTNAQVGSITKIPVKIAAHITNLSDYPDMAVVCYSGFSFSSPATAQLYENEIPGNYSNSQSTVYITKKEYLRKVGIENIDYQNDKNVQKLNLVINWGSVSSSELYSAIDVELKLAKKGSTYYAYKSKVTGKPKANGNQQAAADVVKTYSDNVVDQMQPIYISEKSMN